MVWVLILLGANPLPTCDFSLGIILLLFFSPSSFSLEKCQYPCTFPSLEEAGGPRSVKAEVGAGACCCLNRFIVKVR